MTDAELAAQIVEGGRLRALVLELWQRTRMDWGFVSDRLATTFRKERWVGAHERRFVGETLYGLVRHLRRVDAAIARGRKQSKPPRDLERLLALLVLEKLIEPARAARELGELDWTAVASIDDAIASERKPVTRIALAASLPDWLAERLVAEWGDQAEALARALNQRAPMTLRANLLIGDRESGFTPGEQRRRTAARFDRAALAAELEREGIATRAGAWCDTALHVETRTNIFALAAFQRGACEAMDEGSQLIAELATAGLGDARPLVVDLCAGAGGKTLAIAARLHNRGRIVATDVDAKKLEELRRRARRAGVSNAQAIELPDGRWPPAVEALRGKADVVFVDAPCSGIGALRRNPEARWRLREADLAAFAARQREIARAAIALLAPRGRMVYATCTLLRVENDDVVAALRDELVPIPLTAVVGERAPKLANSDSTALVVTPHRHGTDGFYASVLQRVI